MNWTITYRGKSGDREEAVIEAASRADLFAELKSRGISAISVREGGIVKAPQKPSVLRGLLAGVVIVAVGAIVAFLFLNAHSNEPTQRKPKQKSVVHESPVPKTEKKTTLVVEEKPKKYWEVDAAHTNGFTEMQMRKWSIAHRPPPGYTNNAVLLKPKPYYAIFNHKCENLIASYLTLKPGDGMIGTPKLGNAFRQQFLKSLEEPIIVTEEDSPEDAQLKRDMIATKIDLKARMDEGEDICQILSDTHKEVQELARYKAMLQKDVHAALKDPDMTMEDVDILVEAANKMLEEKGIAPMNLGPITKRLIKRRKGF